MYRHQKQLENTSREENHWKGYRSQKEEKKGHFNAKVKQREQ